MEESKINKEMSEQEFNRFGDAMGLDFEIDYMDEDDIKEFNKQKRVFINAISKGSLTINDDGEPTFTPQRSEAKDSVTFKEPTGATLKSIDNVKATHNVGKMYTIMGEMTKTSASTFSKMKKPDLDVCLAVTTLFLG